MKTLLAILILWSASPCVASSVSVQGMALAPNAGGQESYSIKYFHEKKKIEYGLFSTTYLVTDGNIPLTGVSANYRFDICGKDCAAQAFILLGGGISQIGPYAELTWGSILGWVTRIDITTQLYYSTTENRIITWSYPLWVGISIPF